MEKVPTLSEILEYRRLLQEDRQKNSKNGLYYSAQCRELTLWIFSVKMSDEVSKKAWKYCKTVANYAHAPVTPAEYKRMRKYENDAELIDVLIEVLSEHEYFPSNLRNVPIGFDIIGYWYSIALISQAAYKRKECLAILEKLTNYMIQNKHRDASLILRNMKALYKDYPDLSGYKTALENM